MNLPQPIPRAELNRVFALWDARKKAEGEFMAVWSAIPDETRRAGGPFGPEVEELSQRRRATATACREALDALAVSFSWFWPSRSHTDEAAVTRDFQEALLPVWQHSRRERIAALVAAWNPLKGSETVNPPVSGWALNVRTQQAFKILKASPTGRKVRAVGVDGVVVNLKPSVVHGSAVGSGRSSTSGGWVSCSAELGEIVWALYRDRAEFFAAHSAII